MKLFLLLLLIMLPFGILLSQKSNKIKLGNNNDNNTIIVGSNLYIDKGTTILSSVREDKLINLSPLFITVLEFMEGINTVTQLKTVELKTEYDNLKQKLYKLMHKTHGDHIELLDDVLKDFVVFYLNVLKNGGITESNSINETFVIFNDYNNNRSSFNLNRVNNELFLSKLRSTSDLTGDDFLIYPFVNGMAKVKNKNKYGFIDIYGNLVIRPTYDEVLNFSEGSAICRVGEYTYILNKDGTLIKDKNKLYVSNGDKNILSCQGGWFRVNHLSEADPLYGRHSISCNYLDKNLKPLFSNQDIRFGTDFWNNNAYVYNKKINRYVKINSSGQVIKKLDTNIVFIESSSIGVQLFRKKDSVAYTNPSYLATNDYPEARHIQSTLNNLKYPFRVYNVKISHDSIENYTFQNPNTIPKIKNQLAYKFNPTSLLSYRQYFKENKSRYLYEICDSSDNMLIGPFKDVCLLKNDYFLYSSSIPYVVYYYEGNKQSSEEKVKILKMYRFKAYPNGFGLIKPNSQIIVSRKKKYNILDLYNENLFVVGTIIKSRDSLNVAYDKTYSNSAWYSPFSFETYLNDTPLIILRYGLINSDGVEALPFIYDRIELISKNLVKTMLNGDLTYFIIDSLGNATKMKPQ